MVFSFYSNLPSTQYTLLTSATKSIIGWHILYSSSTYLYLIISSFFQDELKESWELSGTKTCHLNPYGLKVALYPGTAMVEFQLLRQVNIFMDQMNNLLEIIELLYRTKNGTLLTYK